LTDVYTEQMIKDVVYSKPYCRICTCFFNDRGFIWRSNWNFTICKWKREM